MVWFCVDKLNFIAKSWLAKKNFLWINSLMLVYNLCRSGTPKPNPTMLTKLLTT
jgi:hypothetical protein